MPRRAFSYVKGGGKMGSLFVRDRQFYRHFFVIALPVVLQSCITIGVNMLDTIMLGSFGEGYLS